MSVSKWAYLPERCDGDACPGDCDLCSKAQDNIALIEEDNDVVDDLIRRADAVALASGGCHPANLAEELAKLPSAQPERKTGKWIEKHHGYSDEEFVIEEWQSCRCSECGRYDTRPYIYYFSEPNYCSYCGADMRGGEDG